MNHAIKTLLRMFCIAVALGCAVQLYAQGAGQQEWIDIDYASLPHPNMFM